MLRKSLNETALVRSEVRQHARADSISKRAPSTTLMGISSIAILARHESGSVEIRRMNHELE